jgi:hypothetical protein
VKDETKIVVGGLVTVGVIAAVYYLFFFEEDRPPILVRRGSLDVVNSKKWKKKTTHWQPDHPNGKHVSHYEVTVRSGGSSLPPVKGDRVLITYSEGGQSVTVHIETAPETKDKDTPAVRPVNKLQRQTDKKILRHGTTGIGQIDRIEVWLGGALVAQYDDPSSADLYPKKN